MKTSRTFLFFLLAFASWSKVNAQAPVQLTPISNPIFNHSVFSNHPVVVGDNLYLQANPQGKQQVWKTNGTVAGTEMIKDFTITNSNARMSHLVNINNKLYFIDNTSNSNTCNLWQSDGTSAGTTILKTFTGAGSAQLAGLTVINNIGYFIVFANGTALWKTDGTEAGTVLVKDNTASTNQGGNAFYGVNNLVVFFTASASPGYIALWKTDGTANGTIQVKDSILNVNQGQIITEAKTVNNNLYFQIGNKGEFWKTDGTTAGTIKLADLKVASNFTSFSGSMYFNASAGFASTLWKTDGTVGGTQEVPGIGLIQYMSAIGNNLVLNNGKSGYDFEPYKSDGTANGTTLLKNINAAAASAPTSFTKVNNTLCFLADDGVHGSQIWKTDGNIDGTKMAYAENDTLNGLDAVALTALNGHLIFINNTDGKVYSLLVDEKPNGIYSENTQSNINVYPNPSTGIFYSEAGYDMNIDLKIYDFSGKVVYSKLNFKTPESIDINHLENGLYLLQLQTNQGIVTKKIVLQK